MKKISICFLLLAFVTQTTFAQQSTVAPTHAKLSPLTKQYLFYAGSGKPYLQGYVYKRTPDKKLYISALIKVNSTLQAQLLTNLGVHIGTKAGSIWTAQIPIENVEAFTALPGIDYIQLDEPVFPALDSLRVATRVDSAQAGYGLPMPFNGDNVVVGVIDAGFDYTHPELFDTLGANYRVKKLWAQQRTTGTPPNGFAYGSEITDSTDMWAIGTDSMGSHGTHTTGICAGSGYMGFTGTLKFRNRQYRGVAYKSDIVLVAISPDSAQWVNTGVSDIIDGANYIYTYAASVNKPAVINLSWGSPLGPHDGTSLFGEAMDSLTGPGRIFVCSAGNNGKDTIHLQKTFSATDTVVQTFINITNAPSGNKTWVDVWGEQGKTFCVAVTLYTNNSAGNTTGYICLDNTLHHTYVVGKNNDTCFIDFSTSLSEWNNKPHIFMSINNKTKDSICISLKGTEGIVNMWDSYVYGGGGFYSPFRSLGQPWAVSGDVHYTVSDLANTKSAITVAAFVTKLDWSGVNGLSYSYRGYTKKGVLAFFSSFGPSADGSVKPDISAPGFTITSGGSSFDPGLAPTGGDYQFVVTERPFKGRTYPFITFTGTSMAAPAVAGIAAMLLQVNPTLTPQGVKDILNKTAIQDTFTHVLPSTGVNDWGHGKVNAYAAIKEALRTAGIKPTIQGTLNCDVFPNPNKGEFTLSYSGISSEKLLVKVYDLTGRIIENDNWNVIPGDNNRQFDFSTLSKGVYFIKLSSAIGNSVMKVLVQ